MNYGRAVKGVGSEGLDSERDEVAGNFRVYA
jgi:hypothetical protein